MADELTPAVVDVPISTLSQTPPDHAGPMGRLVAMTNAEVKQYLPPQAGGAGGGATPQAVLVQQREGFVALASEQRNADDGGQTFGQFPAPELLSTLGDQLLSIGESIPRVWNGTTWTSYEQSGTRVLTGKLSEDTLHTSSKTIQACDSAIIDTVTCFVWTETNEGLTASYVGFRASDGAWIVSPRVLFAASSSTDVALAKVVSDGSRFWVVFDNSTANLQIAVYDTHGAQLALATKARHWTTSPGFWDIVTSPAGAVLLAQPSLYDPGDEHGIDFTKFTFTGPSTINQTSHVDGTTRTLGPVAWLTNDIPGFSAFSYVAVVIDASEGTQGIVAYEVNESTLTQTHEFDVATTGAATTTATIDSMTGYLISSSGIGVVVAVSLLSNYSPPAGPPNDPGLRSVRVYACTRGGVTALVKQANGVILQSRAFRILTSPASSPDYVAVTYYQSGGGLLPSQTAQSITVTELDSMTGELDQPVQVVAGDAVTGAAGRTILTSGSMFYATNTTFFSSSWSPAVGTDFVDGDTGECKFTTADFGIEITNTPVGSYLRIAGSAVSTNNQDYLILERHFTGGSPTHFIRIETVGTNGDAWLPDDLTGVTASIVATVALWVPEATNGTPVPSEIVNQFIPGTFAIAGAAHSVNNATYTIKRILVHEPFGDGTPLSASGQPFSIFIALKPGSQVFETFTGTATVTPVFPYAWIFSTRTFDPVDIGQNLIVDGAAESGNDGTFPITAQFTNVVFTDAQPALVPEVFASPLPKVSIHLTGTPLTFDFDSFSFDDSYLGAFLTISNAAHPANDGTYEIIAIVSEHVIQCRSATGATGQINETFETGEAGVVATILRQQNTSPAYQPCWLLTPLSVAQQTAGRFEYGIAYADWRFDGAATAATGINVGADFHRNAFPYALSSVAQPHITDNVVALPYRALSFTAGQIVRSGPNVVGIAAVQQSTVGIKQFALSGSTFGQAVANSGELLLPGPMAAAFTASGFHEDGVNFGFEQPFLVSQSTTSDTLGLTLKTSYQVVAVAEVMDENGDRTFSLPSPPLNFTLTGDNNTATYGGRVISPTNRTLIGISLYRTSVQGGVPTVQHYKVTDDLDVNGTGFTFSSVNGGPDPDTWQFVDTRPDAAVLSEEIMYTDKGLTPRFPAPAFSQGVGSWCNRSWVVGYDGAVWMSGEKTEGDAVWFTPLFRYVLPTDDKPVAVAAMDEFLLVFCSRSIWYIPKTDFPGANLQTGSLPTPVQLPYQNGCTGWALTIRGGVAYASSAGGVWMITRQLTNVWLSQDVQTNLTASVTSMLVDEKQRLFVLVGASQVFMFDQVSQCWARWVLPMSAALACSWQGHATVQGTSAPSQVAVHTPNVFADILDGVTRLGCPPDISLAGISLAGVRSFKRCWAIQIVGQYKAAHRLNVAVSYPDEDGQATTSYPPFTPDPAAPYIYEVNPDPEEASTFGLHIFADFVGVSVPGNSFALELISFEVGVERGINQVLPAKRIPSSG